MSEKINTSTDNQPNPAAEAWSNLVPDEPEQATTEPNEVKKLELVFDETDPSHQRELSAFEIKDPQAELTPKQFSEFSKNYLKELFEERDMPQNADPENQRLINNQIGLVSKFENFPTTMNLQKAVNYVQNFYRDLGQQLQQYEDPSSRPRRKFGEPDDGPRYNPNSPADNLFETADTGIQRLVTHFNHYLEGDYHYETSSSATEPTQPQNPAHEDPTNTTPIISSLRDDVL